MKRNLVCLLFVLAIACCPARAQRSKSAAEVDHSYRAADALFGRSDHNAARREVNLALQQNGNDTRALFVAMELAALDADDAGVLNAATRLCAASDSTFEDQLCEVAAARIEELAANSGTFRKAIPAVRRLIASGSPESHRLNLALIAAADDGLPEFELLMQSRESGLLTDWRIVGPLGRFSNSDFDRSFAPEQDGLRKKSYSSRRVQDFQFANGKVDVPDALMRNGVYYAASDLYLRSGGQWRVWVESPGTLEVYVDGQRVLRKDDRAQAQPQVVWQMRRIERGNHRVVVKFIPAAIPFRVAIMPPAGGVKRRYNKPAIHVGPESEFASVALRYWRGDHTGTVTQIGRIPAARKTTVFNMLLARARSRAAGADAPEARDAWLAAAKNASSSAAAEFALAESADAAGRSDHALAALKTIVAKRRDYEPALRLLARIAARLHWRSEAIAAYEQLVGEHPSCSNVKDAAWYLAGIGEYRKAAGLQPQMKSCAPGSLLFARWMAYAGAHAEAASAAADVSLRHPLHREALVLQAEEAKLAGDLEMAAKAEQRLEDISEHPFRRAARDDGETDPHSAGFFNAAEFYAPYRRDGNLVVREAEGRRFSGGPFVTLLKDKVVWVGDDGLAAEYVHTITRVLNREGIEKCGEVALPQGAELLELRTIKSDGSIIEPELNQHKATVSMAALSPGDAIEQEYVVWKRGAVASLENSFEFEFGSFTAPILAARLVLLSEAPVHVLESPDTPKSRDVGSSGRTSTRVWEREDIAQSINEGLLPQTDLLPVIRVATAKTSLEEVVAIARESAVDSSRVGVRAAVLARQFRQTDAKSLAMDLYAHVLAITPDGSDFLTGEVTKAEDSLGDKRGSRTASLLALARACGLQADLALARTVRQNDGRYSHPLVVFHLGTSGGDMIVDVESEGMPFGVLGAELDRSSALLARIAAPQTQAEWIEMPRLEGAHLSIAEGDIVFDDSGTFAARVTITMGAWRAAQMREILRGIPQTERRHFFEQLAMRLFPGASDAEGTVENESALNRTLRLTVNCSSPRYLNMSSTSVDMDQLVPALGLRKMYAGRGTRRWPLFIDSLLFESAVFRVRLPQGAKLLRDVPDLDLRTEFGTYRAAFATMGDRNLIVRREFNIPVQVIPAKRYPEFSAFAARIDETERQRFTISIEGSRHANAAR